MTSSAAANDANTSRRQSQGAGGGPPGSDLHRLSRTGDSLYQLLDLPKTSTDQEIKRKYRRLALKYHPDKNPNNPEAEEMFKKINQANSILSDEKKRAVYDKHGSLGLHFAEQFGDDFVDTIMTFSSGWFQCFFWSCCLLTGCFFGGCCCCCCCFGFCCGKCAPKAPEGEDDIPDLADFEGFAADEEDTAKEGPEVVVAEPAASSNTVIAMPPPNATEEATRPSDTAIPMPPPAYNEVTEATALKDHAGDKKVYTTDMSPS